MKVNIETINGKQCTVIRKPFDANWVKEQLSMGIPVLAEKKDWKAEGEYGYKNLNLILEFAPYYRGSYWCASECQNKGFHGIGYHKSGHRSIEGSWTYILTILPPLPRNPKLEDAWRLHELMAKGISVYFTWDDDRVRKTVWCADDFPVNQLVDEITITHATLNGERVEIALED